MPRNKFREDEDEDLEPIEDKTERLTLNSRRTERAERKRKIRAEKSTHNSHDLLTLPYELLMEILSFMPPSDVFNLARTSKDFHTFIFEKESVITRNIISRRYVCLEKCFRLPVLLEFVDQAIHAALQSDERQEVLAIHRKPYQHIQPPDPTVICTCLTCILRWCALCLIVDFAHWQDNLDKGEPIPMIPRGEMPEWNQTLLADNAAIVSKALHSPLWHVRLLEAHLNSTTRAIHRHAENKGNKRERFMMTKAEMDSGTDLFLEGKGPPSMDLPFHRDNFYMLEAYLPNRGWNSDEERWVYMFTQEHDRDLEFVAKWAEWKGMKIDYKKA